MRSISGMTIAITGASAGIGAELARQLAGRGARVALGARRLDRLEDLARGLGGEAMAQVLDVADPASCAAFVRAAHARWGRLDTLVCNAGFGLLRTVADTSEEDWQAILATNLLGTVSCVRAALPLMRAQQPLSGWRGQVMVVSSSLARRAAGDLGAYCATKAAQLSLCEALRVEEAPHAIAVTSVHPVRVPTEFTAVAERISGTSQKRQRQVPTQPVEAVAAAMLRAIAKPRPEVWPHRLSRLLAAGVGFAPGLGDRIMAGHRRL